MPVFEIGIEHGKRKLSTAARARSRRDIMAHRRFDPMLKPGDAAPDFEVKDDRGRTVRLSDFKGKQDVLLWFYPKADTPG